MILQSFAGFPDSWRISAPLSSSPIGYLFIYMWITPHDEFELIRNNVPGRRLRSG